MQTSLICKSSFICDPHGGLPQLFKHGVGLIDLRAHIPLDRHITAISNYMDNAPEFVDGRARAASGFGALGNPSSFHAPSVRALRRSLADLIRPQLSMAFRQPVALIPDRLCLRLPGTSVTPESWHKDVTEGYDGDILGGWVNLSGHAQEFHCVLGTHDLANCNDGPKSVYGKAHKNKFASIDKPYHPYCKKALTRVVVPPGHMVVFFQHITHRVAPKKLKCHSLRLFVGWSVGKDVVHPVAATIREQGVFKLPSGQTPPMYPQLYRSYPQLFERLKEYSATIKDVCKQPITRHDVEYNLVQRFMPSLTSLGLAKYPPYSKEDEDILKPEAFEGPINAKGFD